MKKGYIRLDSDDLTKANQEHQVRFLDKIKNSIFVTYFQILESKSLSENMGILFISIQFIQMISMSFNDNNEDLTNSQISSILTIPNYFLLYPVILSASQPLFNFAFLSISLAMFAFLFLSIFYISSKSNQEEPFVKSFKNVWGFLSELADKILVVPLVGLAVGNIACEFPNSQVTCYDGVHITLIILSLIGATIMLVLEFFYVYLFFNFTFKIQDSLSRNPSGMQVIFLLCRICITIFQSRFQQNNQSNYTTTVLMHLLFGFLLMYDSLNSFPYHNKYVSKTFGAFSAAYLWINASFMILLITSIEMLHQNVLIIVGLGLAFFLKLFLNIRNYYVKVLMNSELDDIQNDVLLDLKIRNYNTLAKTLDIKKSELLLASLLKIHYDKCQDQNTCPCRRRNTLIDPKKLDNGDQKLQFHKDRVFVKHFITRMVRDGLNKFKDSKLLYLDLIFYRFESMRIYSSIYFEIMKFEDRYHNDMSLSMEFQLYRLGARLKKYLNNRNKKSPVADTLQLEHVREFDEGIIKLRENILTVNRNFQDLWESLQDSVPDLAKILEIGNKGINNIQITNSLYEILLKLNNQSQDLKNLMDIYTNHIIFDELLSFKVNKDISMPTIMEVEHSMHQDFDQLLKKYNIFDENSCVISISPKLENMGQIQWCSRNVSNIFGFEESDLLTMNINQLMPEPLSIHHNRILKYFYDNGREQSTTRVIHTWAVDAEKFLFSCNMFVKIQPSLKSFDIMGFLHKLNCDDYLISDIDGMLFSVGRKVSQLIDLKPKLISESRVNLQLLAPKLMTVFKHYFIDFDDIVIDKSLQQDAPKVNVNNYDDDKVEEIKFFFFIPNNLEERVKSFSEARQATFKKFHVDQVTKEKTSEQVISANGGPQIKTIKAIIKQALEFKQAYAELLHRVNKKIQIKQLKKIIKVKASIKTLTFWNGTKYINLKIIKIISYDVKKQEYIQLNEQKVKSQERFVKVFLKELKKEHNEFKTKKMKMRADEEEDNAEELEAQALGLRKNDNENQGPPVPNQIKGFMNMFKKNQPGGAGKAQPKGNQLFQKMNKFSQFAKMGTFQGGAGGGEDQEKQIKQGILMTLFKPSLMQKRGQGPKNTNVKQQQRATKREGSMLEKEELEKKKIEVSPERLQKMKACPAVPKLINILIKANLLGQSEFSSFFDPKRKKMPLKGMQRWRAIYQSAKFKEYVEKEKNLQIEQKNQKDSSSDFEDESEQKQDSEQTIIGQDEERDLLKMLEKKEVKEEEKAVQQSVGSSTSSLQTHNALRMLRESLKTMKAPQILITANYLIIFLCLLIEAFTMMQFLYLQNDFDGIKQEIDIFRRVSYYSSQMGELYDGYQTLQMINIGTFSSAVYDDVWQEKYRTELFITWQDLGAFFLDDFSQAGKESHSGHDLRAYLFEVLNVSMMINNQDQKKFQFNFENFVRLFANAINQTIQLPLADFRKDPQEKSDFFNFIQHNFDSFLHISDRNFELALSFFNTSLDALQSRYIIFWICSFIVIILCYLFIYPIILKTKITIHETLRIFTKISMRDVDHYTEHYKKICFNLKTVHDSSELLSKIDDEINLLKFQFTKQKAHDSRALSRSRTYKGIKINKILFFLVMTLWLSIFAGIIIAKDIFMINFIKDCYDLSQLHISQYQMKYGYEKNFIKFKKIFQDYFEGIYSENATKSLIDDITFFDTESITIKNYQIFGGFSPDYNIFIDHLLTRNLCEQIQNDTSVTNQYSLTITYCEQLLNGILKKGLLNFYLFLENDMLNGLNLLLDSQDSLESSEKAKHEISEPKYKDYLDGFLYLKIFSRQWSIIEQQAYFIGIDKEIQYNQYFVIILTMITVLFLIGVWYREYSSLKQSSKWVNGFILLIPISVLKENQYIRSFLKKKLKIQSLMYI